MLAVKLLGSIDLENIDSNLHDINNKLDSLPQDISSEFYNTTSGEEGIIQKVYQDLFTLSSGDVLEIYNSINDLISSGDTPISLYYDVFDSLNTQEDFIISWDDINIQLTSNNGQLLLNQHLISGDSVNFSQLVRSNDVLQLIFSWVRILYSFALLFVLFYECYYITLKTIGATSFTEGTDESEFNIISTSEHYSVSSNGSLIKHPDTITKTHTNRTKLK